jgi:hypothetical protein
MTRSLPARRPLPSPSATPCRRFELHVDGDVVAEADDHDSLTALARRYAGYDRVSILRSRG